MTQNLASCAAAMAAQPARISGGATHSRITDRPMPSCFMRSAPCTSHPNSPTPLMPFLGLAERGILSVARTFINGSREKTTASNRPPIALANVVFPVQRTPETETTSTA